MNFQKKHIPAIELLIFTVITIANLIPFISTKFFPSLDGASHLFNANIINQLFFHENDLFHQFFRINPEPVPNWTSHLLIAFMKLIFPAFLAEKILIAGLLAGLPFAFRSLMKTLQPDKLYLSYLIFPFTHSMFLFFGFFNFCLGVIFFLISLNFYLRKKGEMKYFKDFLVLTLLILLTYFSHILVFGVLLILIAAFIISEGISAWISMRSLKKQILKEFFRKTLAITLASAIPLCLFIYFFISRPGTRVVAFLPKSQLVEYLIRIRPLISFNTDKEGVFTILLFFLMAILIFSGLMVMAYRFFRKSESRPGNRHKRWLIPSISLLFFLYFLLPDAYGTASYTSLRLNYLLFLLVVLWIATFRLPRWIGIVAAIFALGINALMIRYDKPIMDEFNRMAIASNKASDFIPANSMVLPIYLMDNWFTGHFVDYVAIDKPIVMVYNYECETGYFPVIWNLGSKPGYYIGNQADTSECLNFIQIKGHKNLKINYVFLVGSYDPAKEWFLYKLDKILRKDYTGIYTTDFCRLYELKER